MAWKELFSTDIGLLSLFTHRFCRRDGGVSLPFREDPYR